MTTAAAACAHAGSGTRHHGRPGSATRPGSSHGLKQAGTEDLVIMIAYETRPRTAPASTAAH